MTADNSTPAGEQVWRWRLLAGALILVTAGLRIAYLVCDCPLDLAPDEAHYWDWSRHLDWSYYSKGPLVAWLIHASCGLLGSWSEQLTGSYMLAVRLPAVLCGSMLLVSLYVLTVQVFGRERLAAALVALALTAPALATGSLLMTIDAPFTCCWGWALVFGHHAIFRGSAWAWPAAGLAVALGILAKYTMILWPLSVGLFLLASPVYRRLLLRPGFWVMIAVAALGGVPILIWNMQNDWVTYHHVHQLAGLNNGTQFYWYGPFAYLGGQCGLLLAFGFIAWVAAMIVYRPWVALDEGTRYLWWLSAPTFLVFLVFSLRTRGGEINWPVTTYISGMVLMVAWLVRQVTSANRGHARRMIACLALACTVSLGAVGLAHHSEHAYSLFAEWLGPPTDVQPLPIRRIDPTCRLRGWRTLAAEVDRLRAELRAEGIEPVLAALTWSLPGELGSYCEGHPIVYSIGRSAGDRHSQYDLWRPNPLDDTSYFQGQTFIIVGGSIPAESNAFDSVGPSHFVTHWERGQPIGRWEIVICRGYRGFSGKWAEKF